MATVELESWKRFLSDGPISNGDLYDESARKMLLFERWYPFVTGLVVAIAYAGASHFRPLVLPDTIPTLLGAVVSVGGIAIGFLATAKSILISIDDKPIVQRVRDAGVYKRILSYMRAAIRWSFWLTLLSAGALLFSFKGLDAKTWTGWYIGGTALWLGLAAASILSYVRVARIWYAILDNIDIEQP